ncbi:pheromone receptor Rcb2 B43 [Ephemerocybe angulata]|uniref:Pheromone receptor Rcb2 B43 n=1 Tax=Ephemerocybe angulata TaxID=980116 RepID=A0A8H6HMU6_9AGAR|nr:pheromone receptor Rcb2 B43 [Tulosesus angulatus]
MAIHPELAPIAFIACISTLLPIPWHWRARNISTLAIAFWFFVSNLIFAVNATVWADNVEIKSRVWCDISSKLVIGANMGLPAACLCISIYLEQVASLRRATSSLADKRKRQWFEAFMGFGLPIIFMGLHFIVQGHRYDIIEGYGCRPTTYYSIPAIFIVWLPPLLMAAGCFIFSGLALRHFVIRRLTFAAHLKNSNAGLTTSRYLRLIAMAVVQMIGVVGVTSYTLWFTSIAVPLRPWTTWSDVHSDFGRVDQFLALFYPPPVARAYYGMWMMVPVSTFLFIAFFAFGKDAMDEYKKCVVWVKVNVLRMEKGDGKSKFASLTSVTSSSKANILPISKPVLQSTTSSDYTLPPSYDMSTSTDSTTRASITNFQQPKAIGSVSDLSILSPSTTIMGCSESTPKALDSGISYPSSTFPAQTRVPVVPEPTSATRLRPLLLLGQRENARRPVTYPSHEAERWTPEGAEDVRQ